MEGTQEPEASVALEPLEEQAKALLLLKDGLGPFYNDQKEALLAPVLALPLAKAAPLLARLVAIGFLESTELASLTSRLLASTTGATKKTATTTTTNVTEKEKEKEASLTKETDTARLLPVLFPSNEAHLLSMPDATREEVEGLFDTLRNALGVTSLAQLLDLEESDRQFDTLEDILLGGGDDSVVARQRQLFRAVTEALTKLLPNELVAERKQQQERALLKQRDTAEMEMERHKQFTRMHQVWCEQAQLLFVPMVADKKLHFFSTVDLLTDDASSSMKEQQMVLRSNTEEGGSSHVIFCLDISASMNHDEKGIYLPPKSNDHPHSSIKKARDLIPPFFMAALKNGVPVTLLVWNNVVSRPITFTPDMFYASKKNGKKEGEKQKEGGGEEEEEENEDDDDMEGGEEFVEDEEMERMLREKTNESVFVATGGTNIEAALAAIAQQMEELRSRDRISNLVVWFLTDGEETRCLDHSAINKNASNLQSTLTKQQVLRIPSNRADPKFNYFNVEDPHTGLTEYQRKMVGDLETACKRLQDESEEDSSDRRGGCSLEFHVCHFGEAHPLLLKALREASNGHFHAVADIERLKGEMAAMASGTNTMLTINGLRTGNEHVVPAAVSKEGILFARGHLPWSFLMEEIVAPPSSAASSSEEKTGIVLRCGKGGKRKEYWLRSHESSVLSEEVSTHVAKILSLEPQLESLLSAIGQDISPSGMERSSQRLEQLKQQRMEAIISLAQHIRNKVALRSFLEKVLESVDTQAKALERMLAQYLRTEAGSYDKTQAKQSEFFNPKEQMAIAAGLESMKVQLGHGFVTQSTLDRQVERLIAQRGAWARDLLHRVCLLACDEDEEEEEEGKEPPKTTLTLLIMEGKDVAEARAALLQRLLKEEMEKGKLFPKAELVEEVITHNKNNPEELLSCVRYRLVGGGRTALSEMRERSGLLTLGEIYPAERVVARHTVVALSKDVSETCKRLCDPLSFSTMLELIQENSTLPAFLYTIAPNQSAGLIYNSKEMMHVVEGGSDATSFAYFRLFWRLADKEGEKEGNSLVRVPGTFSSANFALPIAPEPLSNLVLSNLLPGLLSEFVTGTPMAPLTETGNLYIGFLLMHMKKRPPTGMDVSRMAEILATLACWIDNPKTLPKYHDAMGLVLKLVNGRSVLKQADSPGKYMPVKAFAYALLDGEFPAAAKLEALQRVSLYRSCKLLLGKVEVKKGAAAPPQQRGLSEKLLAEQMVLRKWLRQLVRNLVKLTSPSSSAASSSAASSDEAEKKKEGGEEEEEEEEENKAEIPEDALRIAQELGQLVLLNDDDVSEEEQQSRVLLFLSKEGMLPFLVSTFFELVQRKTRLAFPASFCWRTLQRQFFVWHCIATYPIDKLKESFAAFRSPNEFEQHVITRLEPLRQHKEPFAHTLLSWVDEETEQHCTLQVNLSNNNLFVRDTMTGKGHTLDLKNKEDGRVLWQRFWKQLMLPVFKLWHWKGRPSNGYGLFRLDYDVVRALLDPTNQLIETLNTTQLAEYNAAKEWRNKAYAAFVPPRPEVARLLDEHYTVAKQIARSVTGKPRISVVIIGNVDSGKSTTSGHLITELGFVDKRIVEKYERDARAAGKNTMSKYAWVMDKLRTERELGVTIEVSCWSVETPNYDVDLLDAPGHRSFIKNMTVGASMADVAILVISATDGEFEAGIARGGMTREEALVAYTMGVRNFIVAVNKMDTVGYAQKRFEEIVGEVQRLLRQVGVQDKRTVFIPISGYHGDNLIYPSENMPWYEGWTNGMTGAKGTTLVEALDNLSLPVRPVDKPLRIPILQSFKVTGVGTVAIGRVASGVLRQNDTLMLMPEGLTAQTTSIQIHHTDRAEVLPGDLIGFKVKNCPEPYKEHVYRGLVACHANDRPVRAVKAFIAQILVLNHSNGISAGFCPQLYCHTASFPCRVEELLQKLDKRTGKVVEEKPQKVRTGEAAICLMRPKGGRAVCLETFQELAPLGRFLMRDQGQTAVVGVVKEIVEEEKGGTGLGRKGRAAAGKGRLATGKSYFSQATATRGKRGGRR
ncbi:Eukaryotic peptide chain release factor GTP-binding subunit [Balamuthia mandrillaris]